MQVRTRPARSTVVDAALGLGGAALFAASIAATIGGSLAIGVARAVVTPPNHRRDPVRLLAVDRVRGLVTLQRTTESAAPGNYTLIYDAGVGRCRIGEIDTSTRRTVTRRFSGETGSTLDRVRFVRVASAPERSLDDVGVRWHQVVVSTELGESPAWRFEGGDGSRVAILVHGRGAVLTEPLRSVRLLRDAGWTSLLVAYRNDVGAPPSPDRRFGLGATEWRDIDAAMRAAVDAGARDLLLVGWSMGGATVLQALRHSELRDRIAGVVLESPVVSWRATLRHQGRLLRLPRWVISLAVWLLGSTLAGPLVGLRARLPMADLEFARHLDETSAPILLFHSRGDTVVPYRPSARLARMAPGRITYEEFEDALHVRLWNTDAPRWESAWRRWLSTLTPTRQDGDAGTGPV